MEGKTKPVYSIVHCAAPCLLLVIIFFGCQKIINVDLDGVYYCSKAVLPNMIKNGYGKIINISSIVGVVPMRNQCAFAAAKA